MISALFLIVGIHLTTNFKTCEQTKYLFNATNTKPSSEESLKGKRHTLIGLCPLFIWFKMQVLRHYHIDAFTTLSNI